MGHAPPPAYASLALANLFATSRAVLMKSSANGLSVRFFSVRIATLLCTSGSLTGNAFRRGYLLGGAKVYPDCIVRKRPVARSLLRRLREAVMTDVRGSPRPLA